MFKNNYYFFWGGFCSQWCPSKFVIDGIEYNCAEQYMMAEKARLFNDRGALKAIMETACPATQKKIGRSVKGFDPVKWNEICRLVVYRANLAKFTQNYSLMMELASTADAEIVEASPEDKIWGIGLHERDPRCLDKSQWQGTNWLGEAIMQVRSDIYTILSNASFITDSDSIKAKQISPHQPQRML